MEIRFYANMRRIAGQPSLVIADPDINSLQKAFECLLEIHPVLRSYLMNENGGIHQDVPIFVNGRNPRLTEAGIHALLKPEDVISLFSPISSGRMNVEVLRQPVLGTQE